jgi:RHS repeat-associated protein
MHRFLRVRQARIGLPRRAVTSLQPSLLDRTRLLGFLLHSHKRADSAKSAVRSTDHDQLDRVGQAECLAGAAVGALSIHAMPTTVASYTVRPGSLSGPVSMRWGGVSSFYVPDMQGTTRQLTDSSQTVTDTLVTDAWGREVASAGTTVNSYKAFGQWGYYKDAANRQYVRARHLRNDLGRWVSLDPIVSCSQPYAYVDSSPIIREDPSGLAWTLSNLTATCDNPTAKDYPIRDLCGNAWTERRFCLTCNVDVDCLANPMPAAGTCCPQVGPAMTGSWPVMHDHISKDCGSVCCPPNHWRHNTCNVIVDHHYRSNHPYPTLGCGASVKVTARRGTRICSVQIAIIDAGPAKGSPGDLDLHPLPARQLWQCLTGSTAAFRCGAFTLYGVQISG